MTTNSTTKITKISTPRNLPAIRYHHVNGYIKATILEGTRFSNFSLKIKLHQYLYRYHSYACKFDDPKNQRNTCDLWLESCATYCKYMAINSSRLFLARA